MDPQLRLPTRMVRVYIVRSTLFAFIVCIIFVIALNHSVSYHPIRVRSVHAFSPLISPLNFLILKSNRHGAQVALELMSQPDHEGHTPLEWAAGMRICGLLCYYVHLLFPSLIYTAKYPHPGIFFCRGAILTNNLFSFFFSFSSRLRRCEYYGIFHAERAKSLPQRPHESNCIILGRQGTYLAPFLVLVFVTEFY